MAVNALSIDVEEWYSAELVRRSPSKPVDQLELTLEPILDLLESKDIKATFFFLGNVVEKNQRLVRRVKKEGHEICSHGFSHTPLHELNTDSFEKELIATEHVLKKTAGVTPKGFRAPTFSLNNKTKWALEVLIKRKYSYDSSIFPVNAGLYGVPGAPVSIYRPSLTDVSKIDSNTPLFEVPLTVVNIFGKNIPLAGGFYLRFFPFKFVDWGIRKVNKQGRNAVVYLHPWEVFADTPKPVGVSLKDYWITCYGRKSGLNKLKNLLNKFEFCPISEILPKSL